MVALIQQLYTLKAGILLQLTHFLEVIGHWMLSESVSE